MGVDFAQMLETDEETIARQNEGHHAHIIDRGDDPRPAEALVLEARVNGTMLTALCGYQWVPSRDPLKLPLCSKCAEMLEFARDLRGV